MLNVLNQIVFHNDGSSERENAAQHVSNAMTLILLLKTKSVTETTILLAPLDFSLALIAKTQFLPQIEWKLPLPSVIATKPVVKDWMNKPFVF